MKTLIAILLIIFCFYGTVLSQNELNVLSPQGNAADTVSVALSINNSDTFVAFQTDIQLPGQVNYITNSAELTSRDSGHTISASMLANNILRIIVFSINQNTISGNSGIAAKFKIKLGDIPGSFPINLLNPVISNANSINILTGFNNGTVVINAPDISSNLQNIDFGRIPLQHNLERSITIYNNGNTSLNISRSYTDNQYFEIIGDTLFTISPSSSRSITIRFNSAVKGNYNSKLFINSNDPDEPTITIDLTAIAFAVNEIHLNSSSGRSGHPVSISFNINNMENFVGFQFDLILPSVLTYIQDSISLSSRTVDHSISANYIGNNRLRVIAFSPTNTPFSGLNGLIGSIKFSLNGKGGNYNIALDSVYITDNQAENIISAYYGNSVNIASPDIDGATQINMGEVSVMDTLSANYTLNNYGNDTLKVTSISSPYSYFWSDEQLPLVIPPGHNSNFNFLFFNNLKGSYADRFIIRSNDPDEDPFYVNINASSFAPNYMLVRDTTGTIGDTVTIKLDVNNYETFVAFQTDLSLPDSLTYVPNSARLTSRGANHSLSVGYINNTSNTLRIFSFSLNQSDFSGNSGTIVELKCSVGNQTGTFPIKLQNSIISNTNSVNIIKSTLNGSVTIHNKVPAIINLLSPVPGLTGMIQPITLKWEKSNLVASYKVQASADAGFTTTVLDTTGLTDTTFTLSSLSELTKYYWRVKAVNDGGESSWSETWNFKTLGQPTTVTQIYPGSEAVNIPIDLTFVWSKAKDKLKPIRVKPNGIMTVSNYWFELTADTTGMAVISDNNISDTTYTITGLNNLTNYWWRVRAKNEAGWGNYTAWSKFTTVVDTPAVVELSLPSNNSVGNVLLINLVWNSSELASSYKVQVSTTMDFASTLLDTAGLTDTTLSLSALNNLTKYYWRVKSVNVGGESSWSETWNFTTRANKYNVVVDAGWNIISVPVTAADMTKGYLFKTSTSAAFSFNNGYTTATTLENGKGYWLKFDNTQTVQIAGAPVTDSTIIVVSGWNLIGGYDKAIATDKITSSPTGIINSSFFGYTNGYYVADTLSPGKGYWLKAGESGELNISSALANGQGSRTLFVNTIQQDWGKIKVTDAKGNIGNIYLGKDPSDKMVYELPPKPPLGVFDVRYSSNTYLENMDGTKEIEIGTQNYPVTIIISKIKRLRIYDKATGGKLIDKTIADGGKVTISNKYITSLILEEKVIPVIFSLEQNYPNPFNPTTTIKYGLPERAKVKLIIYNTLGEKIKELVNKTQEGGCYQVIWNASSYASGVYIYRIEAGKYSNSKKLILVK